MLRTILLALGFLLLTSAAAWAQLERDTNSRTRPTRSSGQFSEDFLSGKQQPAVREEPAPAADSLSAAQVVMAQAIANNIDSFAAEVLKQFAEPEPLVEPEPYVETGAATELAIAEVATKLNPPIPAESALTSGPELATAEPQEAAQNGSPELETYDWGFPAEELEPAPDTVESTEQAPAAATEPDAALADAELLPQSDEESTAQAPGSAPVVEEDPWLAWEPPAELSDEPTLEPRTEFGSHSDTPAVDEPPTLEVPSALGEPEPVPTPPAASETDPDKILASLELLSEQTAGSSLATTPVAAPGPSQTAAPQLLSPGAWPPAMPDYDIPPAMQELARGTTREQVVALTFDDGPHPEFTSQLLAVLDYYDVPATFFFVGVQAQKHPQWVQMASQSGHEIASQTYDHFRMPKLPREEKVYQIDEYQRLIEGLTGQTPRFLRPPGGQLDDETRGLLNERGMILGLWDVAINDTGEYRTKDQLLSVSLNHVRAGSVLLAHDGIQATVDMLPELIETLRQRGYRFVTMSELASLSD